MSALLLASNSPRRRGLLADAGFKFDVMAPKVVERFDLNLTLRELAAWNAVRKGTVAARIHPAKIVLAADTLVAIDHQILGKPRDRAEAFDMLRQLSGRVHEVCSAVFICYLAAGKSISFCELSRVHFRRLSESAIRSYIDKVNPVDKAAGYAAQESANEIISKIDGSFTNVVGLPMEKTTAALAEFGIKPK